MSSSKNDLYKAQFDLFKVLNRDVFPYRNVRLTRNSCHCKWLVLKASAPTSNHAKGPYSVVCRSSLSRHTFNEMILRKDGLPMPDLFGEIIDTLSGWWHEQWFQDALEYFYNFGNHRPLNREMVFLDVIELRAVRLLEMKYIHMPVVMHGVHLNWIHQFRHLCEEFGIARPFEAIAKRSLLVLNRLMREQDDYLSTVAMPTPRARDTVTPVPVTPDSNMSM